MSGATSALSLKFNHIISSPTVRINTFFGCRFLTGEAIPNDRKIASQKCLARGIWCLSARPFRQLLIPQRPSQYLADERLGQRVAELDLTRDLVARQIFAAVGDDLVRRCRLARLEHEVRLDVIAALDVGDAHRRGFQHFGMLVQHLFDLARVDVESADDEHVLLAVDDGE